LKVVNTLYYSYHRLSLTIQHSLPERQTRSQARTQTVLTPTPRVPFDGTTSVPQLRAQLDRGPIMEGAAPSRKEGRGPRRSSSFSGVVGGVPGISRTILKVPGEDDEEEEENSVEEEESNGTEAAPAPMGESQGTGRPTIAQFDQPVSHQSEPSLLAIMQQMTQIMPNLQSASSSESSRPPAFKTPSVKAPACFDGTQPFKFRSFILSCQLNFHNDQENFSQDRNKVLYSTSFLIGRAAKWIEPYLSNLNNQDPSDLLKSSLYMVTRMKSLVSRIGDLGERALIYHFRRGLDSRILDQLASHPSRIDSLQDLMHITLELDSRYHERQNENHHHQEKKPEASKPNSSHPQNYSSSSHKKEKNFQRRDKPNSSLLNKDFKLMNYEK
ncbi:hypothetical protein O181_077417, partial [Austropuccinia psidii MF-1]|nr:hypothetical protein [Austropuccinia psidii MF-1]